MEQYTIQFAKDWPEHWEEAKTYFFGNMSDAGIVNQNSPNVMTFSYNLHGISWTASFSIKGKQEIFASNRLSRLVQQIIDCLTEK